MGLKKIALFMIVSVILIFNAGAINVYVDGNELNTDVPAQAIEGRTLVPVAPIFQALGASVNWDGATQTVTGQKGNTIISLQIGSNTAYVNGEPILLDVPAQAINGRTMVPVAFIAQSLGANVAWNAEKGHVRIASKLYDVVRTIDGDTIVVDIDGKEETVRLIGVDAPESVHPTASKNTPAGKAASLFTSAHLTDTKVEIETDVQERDKYGRLLAYVYVDGKMFNEKLLKTGHASISTYPPNIKYTEEFEDIIAGRDPSIPSGEYDNGYMKAPKVVYTTTAAKNGLSQSFYYEDGTIKDFKTISSNKILILETKHGDIAIIEIPELSNLSNLKKGDSVRIGFSYLGYSEVLDCPSGSYLETLKKFETDQKPNESTQEPNGSTNQSRTVYVTRTGKRYHFNGNCNGGTYYKSTLAEAKNRGLTPCNKCAK